MKKTGLLIYSSKTGNTKKLAETVHSKLSGFCDFSDIDHAPDPGKYSWIIIGFWVDRGTADKKTLNLLNKIKNKPIVCIGTLGASPESEHAVKVRQTIAEIAGKENEYLGCFLCQGKISQELIQKFEQLPPGNPHSVTEEKRKRYEEAAKHPNDADFEACHIFCRKVLNLI